MPNLEEIIANVNDLIELTARGETKFQGEFIQILLLDLIPKLFQQPVREQTTTRLKELCKRIAAMNKATSVGINFYERLEQSNLPFAEEVLREAIQTEPYYNCHSAAQVNYILVASRNAEIPKKNIEELRRLLPGHDFLFYDSLHTIGDVRPQEEITIPKELKETLIYAVLQDSFMATRGAALAAIVYFNVKDIVPELKPKLRQYTQEFSEKVAEGVKPTSSGTPQLAQITLITTALEYLTGDTRYRELTEFVLLQIQPVRNTDYPDGFADTLTTKTKTLLEE